ncbi:MULTISPECIES: hypothetical protein [unclassified Microbacterium]|uniref:hypothetical protein n=1 Tax=unclassified Microbacterium TaxID=2609290 RepID=UPI0021A6E53E|nr:MULTISPECIES: hypothetical protein [unclassified Microbacterium]MCT1365057.1 hypothetical protein [Microbacterium sp. p3-SID131]MCT1378279.1 hypothetical protein [Microbacterium sp. p3-SID337]
MAIKPAPVSNDVFERILVAIEEMSGSSTLRRTKREIENIAALSHATVARAFAQDLREPTRYAINERFSALQGETGGLSVDGMKQRTTDDELEESRARVKALEDERAIHLQTIYALWLAVQPDESAAPVVRIKRPRSPYLP